MELVGQMRDVQLGHGLELDDHLDADSAKMKCNAIHIIRMQ